MKWCTKCEQFKPSVEFNVHKKSGYLKPICKQCQKEYNRNYWQVWYARESNQTLMIKRSLVRNEQRKKENQQRVLEYLQEHPCVNCGESDPVVLTFDHVRGIKRKEITLMLQYSWKTIQKEIDKCEVRCFNCHIRRHAKESNHFRYTDM